MLQFRQRAGGPDADHAAAGIKPPVERLDVRSSLWFAERDVNGRKDAAREGQQVRRKNNLRLAQPGMFENFRRVAVREKIISPEIFIHFGELELAPRDSACSRSAGRAT